MSDKVAKSTSVVIATPVDSFQRIWSTVTNVLKFVLTKEVLEQFIVISLFILFPLGYLESLRWPFPGPRATHGIIKGLFLIITFLLIVFKKKLRPQQLPVQNFLMVLFVLSYSISAALTFALGSAELHIWYPLIACCIVFALSKVSLPKSYQMILIGISAVLIFLTFSFSFFSLMFRYSVDNIYYFLFLDHRANHLLDELRQYGKYVSLGPYLMLTPLCSIFLIQAKATMHRKLLSIFTLIITLLTAVISNNRIDVLVIAIQAGILLWLFPRRMALLLMFASIPIILFGLMVTERYFGFNIEERIFRPKVERDLETVDIRFTYWQTAFNNFNNFPFFGTGPNSYNEVSVFPIRRYYDPNVRDFLWKLDQGIGVHNIFIERMSDTGLFGFFTFILLLLYFIRRDALYLLQGVSNEKKKVYVLFALSSWTWILYGITDNGYGAQGYLTFFFLRGVINHL